MRFGSSLVPLALALLLASAQGHAESETRGDGVRAAGWIRPEEVSARADALLRRLDAARPDAAARAALERIEQGMARLTPDLDAALTRTAAVRRSASPPELEDLRLELTGTAAPLDGWKEELAAEAKRVALTLDEIARDQRVWSETRARPETAAAGEVVVRRVETSLAALGEAETSQRAWRARVLATSDRVLDRDAAVEGALERVRVESEAKRTSLLVPDRRPLWERDLGADVRRELPRVAGEIAAYRRSTLEYALQDWRPFVVQGLLAALLMLAFHGLSVRARRRLADGGEPSRAARVFERPYAIGLLLALLASPALHPLAPRRLTQLMATIALLPTARIVVHASEHASATLFAGLVVLALLDRLTLALAGLPVLSRASFLLSLLLALALALWFSRRLARTDGSVWLRRAARLAMAGLALGLLAEVGGWTNLATLVGRGTIASAVGGLYIYTAVITLEAALAYGLTSGTLRRSRLIARDAGALGRRAERGLRGLGVGVWLYFVSMALGLRGVGADALRGLVHAGVSVGALTITVGDLLAFALALLAAPFLARVVTDVLEEDVYPRTRLPRGVPYALSTLIRYGIYSLGFLLALAAAGVRLGQLGILLGGMGVGIGLGLQDLVKNFAAGLTLLVERRVHVGDAIQTSSQEIFGRVLAIGMRATMVRNWNGTEIVVPNADLVSGAVTNWTLSDRLCRLEVAVGVAYGTDPERVLALLLDAVRSVGELLADPAPQALFKGFGESSLDFVVRAWIEGGYERVLPLTSELALAVHHQLREAGITVPFPQRDLHLASVSPAARAALSAADREE